MGTGQKAYSVKAEKEEQAYMNSNFVVQTSHLVLLEHWDLRGSDWIHVGSDGHKKCKQ
jgi:hypothetical protein